MNNYFKILGCLTIILSLDSSYAQTVKIEKGSAFENDGKDLDYLGKNEQFIFYHGNTYSQIGDYVLKIDIKSLDVVEKITISKLKTNGKMEKIQLMGNEMLIFCSTPKYKKQEQIGKELKVYVFDVNLSFKLNKEAVISELFGNSYMYISYIEWSKSYIVFNNDKEYYFDGNFQAVANVNRQQEHPLPLKLKNIRISRDFLNSRTVTPDEETYFYRFGQRGDVRYYAKAEFVKDTKCVKTEGHIRNLEIITYDTINNFRKDNYKFEIREESYLMDYTVSLHQDGRIIIIGAYQDKETHGGEIHLGLFTKIIEPEMREKIPAYYTELVSKKREEFINDNKKNEVYSYFNFISYNVGNMIYKNHYVSRSFNYNCKDAAYQYMLIDKQTGVIGSEKLRIPHSCNVGHLFFTGFMNQRCSDSVEWICFNDCRYNIGLTANDPGLIAHGKNLDSVALAFVTFSTSNGFSKRQLIYEAGKEGFVLTMDYSATFTGKPDAEGKFEMITIAGDIDKKKFKVYRFFVDM